MTEAAGVGARGFDAKYWGFRLAAMVVPLVPLWLARRVAVAGGLAAWALATSLRRRGEWNLGHIPTLAANPARMERATREVFVTLALNYLDFFRGRYVTWDELATGWTIEGWDEVKRALALGKGLIVFSAHFGPFEYAAWKLGELKTLMVTPAERLKPERLHQFVAAMRNHHGTRMIAGDDRENLRELLAALRNGGIALFAVDRWIMGPSEPWPFFGALAKLPTAPFALAARSEAPVFLLAARRDGFHHTIGTVEALTPERMTGERTRAGERGGDREAAITRMRERTYAALERLIAAHPGDWVSALSPVWEQPMEPTTAMSSDERLASR